MKRCPHCGLTKPLTDFHKSSRYGVSSYCKACRLVVNRGRRPLKYGLTDESLAELTEQQGGMCKICKTRPAERIDHCHEKGHVRGLLCNNCNVGLGMFADDPTLLQAAIDYLKGN